jgi:hypothetical protein
MVPLNTSFNNASEQGMPKVKTSKTIQLIAGILILATGVAVFAVRLRHEGPYAMPHGGPLLAGVGAIAIGALLIWTKKPNWIGWIALALSPAALFPCIYSIMGEWEEVVSIYAVDSAGQETDLRLWIVDRDDGEWVGMSRGKATDYSLDGAQLRLLRDGEIRCVTPALVDDRETIQVIHAMKVEKYSTAQFAANIGLYPRRATENTAALRLDPCS